jgi:putative transposase
MKTVPIVRLADTADAVAFPDLPEEIQLAMTDIAGAAREGLMAMSVAAGMAVMAAMFEAEIAQVCGPKGKHDAGRAAVRHGTGKGSVTLGGRRVRVDRPRARSIDGHEVPLSSYAHFAAEDLLSQVVMERMLAGVATRRHARTAEPVGTQVDKEAKSTSRSAISRRFVRQTETALAELMARDLAGGDITVLMVDGEHMAERCVVVTLAITADGTKKPVGLWDGSTENKTVVRSLLADLVERGLTFDDGLLVVIDGAKALAAAVREVFGAKALIQRCTLHKQIMSFRLCRNQRTGPLRLRSRRSITPKISIRPGSRSKPSRSITARSTRKRSPRSSTILTCWWNSTNTPPNTGSICGPPIPLKAPSPPCVYEPTSPRDRDGARLESPWPTSSSKPPRPAGAP